MAKKNYYLAFAIILLILLNLYYVSAQVQTVISNNESRKRIDLGNIIIETPVATTCIWEINNPMRKCYQDVYIEYKGSSVLGILTTQFKYSFKSDKAKNIKIINPYSQFSKGNNYTITYSFEYPVNSGEDWNISFDNGLIKWEIDEPIISACSVLSSIGVYTLNQSILNSASSVCMDINASNVELNCDGYTIDGIDTASSVGVKLYGLLALNLNNITVKNCNISDFWYNLYGFYTENSTIDNITAISSSQYGLYFFSIDGINFSNIMATQSTSTGVVIIGIGSNNSFININSSNNIANGFNYGMKDGNFINITANFNNNAGFNFGSGSTINRIINSTFKNNYYGIYFNTNTTYITVKNSTIEKNTLYGIYLFSENNILFNNIINNSNNIYSLLKNYWNNTLNTTQQNIRGKINLGGNFWSNSSKNNGFSDTDCIDISSPYFICENSYIYNANNTDFLPLSNRTVVPNALFQDLNCYYDKKPLFNPINNKIKWICETKNITKCIAFIKDITGNLTGVFPEIKYIEHIGEIGFYECPKLCNIEFETNNLLSGKNYTFGVLCENLEFNASITPKYYLMENQITNRLIWTKENVPYLILAFIVLALLLALSIWLFKKIMKELKFW